MRFSGSLLVVCLGLGAVHAETPQQKADRLFAEGRKLLTVDKDARAACDKFEAAIKLDPTAPGTMLNLGLCYENLEKYATSIRWFRRAQAAAAENHLEVYEDAAKKHTTAIADKVPTLNIQLEGVPDAEIRLDGRRLEPTEYARVEVDAGQHEVVGIAPGKQRVVETVDVAQAEHKPLTLTFTDALVLVDRGTGHKRAAMWIGAGGLGLYAATLGYGLYLRGEQKDANATGDTERYDTATSRLKYIDTGLFIAGTAAVATAVILYVTAPGTEQLPAGTALAPVLGGDQLGLAVSGRF